MSAFLAFPRDEERNARAPVLGAARDEETSMAQHEKRVSVWKDGMARAGTRVS